MVQSFPPLALTNQGRIIKFQNRDQSLIAPVEPTIVDKQGRERDRNKQSAKEKEDGGKMEKNDRNHDCVITPP